LTESKIILKKRRKMSQTRITRKVLGHGVEMAELMDLDE
jgi:hypothetical protein